MGPRGCGPCTRALSRVFSRGRSLERYQYWKGELMSVRRLAKEQPDAFAFTPEAQEQVRWWIAKFPQGRQQSAVIPLLWLVQKQVGWVPEPALRAVADILQMPLIRVLEIVTFY